MRVVGYTLGGFVAGEGSFIVTTGARLVDGSPRMRWVFDVSVARRDQHLLGALQALLGVGSVYERPARRPERQPISSFTVSSRKAHRERVIPFGEQFLLPCAKRRQFELWRDSLYHYESVTPARTRSQCSIDGCDRLVRGRGLCRQHYYRATGNRRCGSVRSGFHRRRGHVPAHREAVVQLCRCARGDRSMRRRTPPRLLRGRACALVPSPQAALRRRDPLDREGVARPHGRDRAVHGCALAGVVQAGAVPRVAERAARLLGTRSTTTRHVLGARVRRAAPAYGWCRRHLYVYRRM
jgi:hypothetical protein